MPDNEEFANQLKLHNAMVAFNQLIYLEMTKVEPDERLLDTYRALLESLARNVVTKHLAENAEA